MKVWNSADIIDEPRNIDVFGELPCGFIFHFLHSRVLHMKISGVVALRLRDGHTFNMTDDDEIIRLAPGTKIEMIVNKTIDEKEIFVREGNNAA